MPFTVQQCTITSTWSDSQGDWASSPECGTFMTKARTGQSSGGILSEIKEASTGLFSGVTNAFKDVGNVLGDVWEGAAKVAEGFAVGAGTGLVSGGLPGLVTGSLAGFGKGIDGALKGESWGKIAEESAKFGGMVGGGTGFAGGTGLGGMASNYIGQAGTALIDGAKVVGGGLLKGLGATQLGAQLLGLGQGATNIQLPNLQGLRMPNLQGLQQYLPAVKDLLPAVAGPGGVAQPVDPKEAAAQLLNGVAPQQPVIVNTPAPAGSGVSTGMLALGAALVVALVYMLLRKKR